MRPSKKAQRRTEKAAAGLKDFLIQFGHDPDKVEKAFEDTPLNDDEKILQAEGVILHLQKPTRFVTKKCKRKQCGELFATSYVSVAYCSNVCRGKDLESQTGIHWNPHIDRYQNLQAEPPMVIGPQAYKVLIEFAEYILAQRNQIQIQEDLELESQNILPEVQEQETEFHQLNGVSRTSPESSLPQLIDLSPLDSLIGGSPFDS
jgi:hypothetical protein